MTENLTGAQALFRALEKDNKELKQMVADLLLEKRVLKVALEKKL